MTARFAALALTVGLLPLAGRVAADDLILAEGGKSAYRIVVGADASPSARHGAEELRNFLREITGATLEIVSDRDPAGAKEILVGSSARLKDLKVELDLAGLGNEGYVIRTVGPHLVLAGGALRGSMYAVYGFLEDHLGCRWFAPGVSRIPKIDRLVVRALDERNVPALEYREPFTFDCFDGDWCARNRMNSSTGRLEPKHGGKVRFGNGFFVHSFDHLVPAAKHFDKHPEYFSMVKGKRIKDHTQLCCTNEEVIQLCIEGIRAAMRAQPDAFVFSVSQNDWANYCECDKCQAIAKAEDSQGAPVFYLVNRVAEAVEKDFPDKAVETLAYQWTRRPPKNWRPRPNVIIRLCSIECCFAHPLGTCDSEANRRFHQDLQGWAKASKRLWVWDYVTDFANYLLPFPNQRVRNDNIQLYVKNNVRGIFEQDTYETPHSEMAALGGYLTAKFLWNPAYDEQFAMGEFLEGYYGKAAGPVRKYLDLLHDYVEKNNIHVMIYVPPTHNHLTTDLLVQADALWQEAEKLAAAEPDVLRRVKLGRMSVDYAVVERARAAAGKKDKADAKLMALAAARYKPFMETLGTSGMTQLREGQVLKFDEYRAGLAAALGLKP